MTRLQKIWLFSLVLLFAITLLGTFGDLLLVRLNYLPFLDTLTFQRKCLVPTVVPDQDQNHNGIPDSIDLVNGARQEVTGHTWWYDTSYYQGGYPPEGRGDDTDVIWRAFRAAGYNLKDMVDADIRTDPAAYKAFVKQPDPNIDFRMVGVLDIFFQRHATDAEQGCRARRRQQPGAMAARRHRGIRPAHRSRPYRHHFRPEAERWRAPGHPQRRALGDRGRLPPALAQQDLPSLPVHCFLKQPGRGNRPLDYDKRLLTKAAFYHAQRWTIFRSFNRMFVQE